MIDSKAFEIKFKTQLTGQQETLDQFGQFSTQMASAFSAAFDQALAQLQQKMTQLVDPSGRPISSGPSGGVNPGFGPATVTAPPPVAQAGPAPFSFGGSSFPGSVYGMAGIGSGPFSQMSQSLYTQSQSPYGANMEMDLASGEARAFNQVRRAGVDTQLTGDSRERLESQRDLAKETLQTALENLKGLSAALREATHGQENLRSEIAELRKKVETGDTTAAGSLQTKLSKQQEIDTLLSAREAGMAAVGKGSQSVQELNTALIRPDPVQWFRSPEFITAVGGAAETLMFAGSMNNAVARSQGFEIQNTRMSARAAMSGDFEQVLINQELGGDPSMRRQSLTDTLMKSASKVGAAAMAGMGVAGPWGAAGAGIGMLGYEALHFNENTNAMMKGQQDAERVKNQEKYESFVAASGFSRQAVSTARALGTTNFSDFLSGGSGMGATFGNLTPGETMNINQRLIQSMGSAATRMPWEQQSGIYGMAGNGLSNAPEIAGQMFMGGNNNAANNLNRMQRNASGFIEASRLPQLFGQFGQEAGRGLGAEFGASQRFGGVLAATQQYGGGDRSGIVGMEFQHQTQNMQAFAGSNLSGMLGTMSSLPAIAQALGIPLDELDIDDIDFLNRYASTMSPTALMDHFKAKGKRVGSHGASAAATLTVRSQFAGIQQMSRILGPGLGGAYSRAAGGATTAGAAAAAELSGLLSKEATGAQPRATAPAASQASDALNQYATAAAQEAATISVGLKHLGQALPALVRAVEQSTANLNSSWSSTMFTPSN